MGELSNLVISARVDEGLVGYNPASLRFSDRKVRYVRYEFGKGPYVSFGITFLPHFAEHFKGLGYLQLLPREKPSGRDSYDENEYPFAIDGQEIMWLNSPTWQLNTGGSRYGARFVFNPEHPRLEETLSAVDVYMMETFKKTDAFKDHR